VRDAFKTQAELDEARRMARVDLLPADVFRDETVAFDVIVEGLGLIGRWSHADGPSGNVTWTTGQSFETGDCDLKEHRILAAVRETIPFGVEESRRPRRFLDRVLPGNKVRISDRHRR
jgi:hypothetical protein